MHTNESSRTASPNNLERTLNSKYLKPKFNDFSVIKVGKIVPVALPKSIPIDKTADHAIKKL